MLTVFCCYSYVIVKNPSKKIFENPSSLVGGEIMKAEIH